MLPVGVSKLGYIGLIFIDHGVKVNGPYNRDVLLSQQLLPAVYVRSQSHTIHLLARLPQRTGHVFGINIPQGSVATHLRCAGGN